MTNALIVTEPTPGLLVASYGYTKWLEFNRDAEPIYSWHEGPPIGFKTSPWEVSLEMVAQQIVQRTGDFSDFWSNFRQGWDNYKGAPAGALPNQAPELMP